MGEPVEEKKVVPFFRKLPIWYLASPHCGPSSAK
jgi:hypothetical protein